MRAYLVRVQHVLAPVVARHRRVADHALLEQDAGEQGAKQSGDAREQEHRQAREPGERELGRAAADHAVRGRERPLERLQRAEAAYQRKRAPGEAVQQSQRHHICRKSWV